MQLKNICVSNSQVIAQGEAEWNFDCHVYNCPLIVLKSGQD